MQKSQRLGAHAIIIGGSVAGLMTAAVLARHFDRITILDRDQMPDEPGFRKGVPQGQHAHGLTVRAFQIMERVLPGTRAHLVAHRAVLDQDLGHIFKSFQYGAYWETPCESGITGTLVSRALLDWAFRQELAKIDAVTIRTGVTVSGLVAKDDAITGVLAHAKGSDIKETLDADLVVDASGRGSQLPKWLEVLGFPGPEESEVRVDVGYSSRLYKRSVPDDAEPPVYLIASTPPAGKRLSAIMPVEGGRWHLTLAGTCGDHPPTDEEGFRAFARSLPAPEAINIIENEEPAGEITQYKFPSNMRRHYEGLQRAPDNLLVLGDAISSFNPIYGQGMTVSSLEIEQLAAMLEAPNASLKGVLPRFMRRITPIVDMAWQMATGEDFRHPEVTGKRPPGIGLLHRYTAAAMRAAHRDTKVHVTFLKVINMQAGPGSLFAPDILWRVFRNSFFGARAGG